MKAVLIIYDKEIINKNSSNLKDMLKKLLLMNNYNIKEFGIDEKNLKNCIGCCSCWIKTPGECIINDSMIEINQSYVNSEIVIYISPIVFGQFSSNMKNVIDRNLPNILPIRENINGIEKQVLRYKKYPAQYIIGYESNITDEEKKTFLDITHNHLQYIKGIFISQVAKDNENIINSIKEML